MVRSLIADLLAQYGYVPLEASGGAEALAIHAREPELAAVILDLSMPDGGGVPVLRELRRRAAELPVILASGLAESDALGVAGAEQAAGFLPKPFTARRMLEELARALRGG
jgi:CheY-like chemotaxis protein